MRVLLATDFSAHADDGRELVAGLAVPPGSQVRIVHVVEPFPEVTAFAPVAVTALTEAAERDANAELERMAGSFRRRGTAADTVLAFGRAADVIVEEAGRFRADLLVIGSRGRRAIASAVLGSVSAEVVDRAPCPVLVARGRTLSRVVLAEDGSPSAAAGARLIAETGALRHLPIRVVSVVDAPFPYLISGDDSGVSAFEAMKAYYDSLPALRDARDRAARQRAEELTVAGVNATFEVREGDAAAQLIEAAAADRADCIIIGSRGRTGLARIFLGSVARAVLFNAACSVLVVHGAAAPAPAKTERELATAR